MNSTFDAFSLPTTNNMMAGLSDPRHEVVSYWNLLLHDPIR